MLLDICVCVCVCACVCVQDAILKIHLQDRICKLQSERCNMQDISKMGQFFTSKDWRNSVKDSF